MKHIYTILASLIFISCNQNANKTGITISKKPADVKTKIVEKEKLVSSHKSYELNNIQIKLTQIKGDGTNFYCKSKIVISRGNNIIDSISFTPEPVGGYYGISKPIKIDNHLVFTKHGDYDGRTILVNEKGKAFNIIGGNNYYDSESKLLFSSYESDLSGLAVFDLTSDSILLEIPEIENRPISFHKAFGERFFILCSNDATNDNTKSVWEIEFDFKRIMQVDLDTNQINKTNILKTWTLEDVNCECEK